VRRAGHNVTALVRSKDKARALLGGEVNVVVGDVYDTKSWVPAAKHAKVIINAGADYQQFARYEKTIIDGFTEAAKGDYKDVKDIPHSAKKLLVYLSGTFALKVTNTPNPKTEDDAVETEGFLAPRPLTEKTVIALPFAHGVVIRPPKVFGGRAQNFFHWFEGAVKGSVVVTAPKNIGSVIHVDDVANAFVRLLAVPVSTIAGEIIHIASDEHVTDLQIAQAYSAAAGFKGTITIDESKAHPLFDRTHVVSTEKAYRLLGFRTSRSIIESAPQLFAAWQVVGGGTPAAQYLRDMYIKTAEGSAAKK